MINGKDTAVVGGKTPPPSSNLDPALQYAAMGWPLFPVHSIRNGECSCGNPECSSPGKHPRDPYGHGFKDATTDKEQIIKWWHKWPDANIGLATGGMSGIVDIDIDPRHGGPESIAKLVKEYGTLPRTVKQRTGGGGYQLLFQHPGGVIKSRTGIRPGIDIKADGGYLVAPPSNHHSGGQYEWEHSLEDTELATLPPAWSDLIQSHQAGDEEPLNLEANDPIPFGMRDTYLTRVAGGVVRWGADEEETRNLLASMNQRRCDPPLSVAQVKKIARSSSKWPPEESPLNVPCSRGHTLEDLLARDDLPEKDPLVEHLLSRRDLVCLGGRRRHGKTTFLINLAVAMALGLSDYMGYKILKPAKTSLFLLEDDIKELEKKFRLVVDGRDSSGRIQVFNWEDFHDRNIPIDIKKATFKQALRDFVGDHNPDLIVIDNLAQVVGAKYNDSNLIHNLIVEMRSWAREFDAAIIIAAHPRKQDYQNPAHLEKDSQRFFEEIMGSSHLVNSTGNLWGLERRDREGYSVFLGGRQRVEGEESCSFIIQGEDGWFRVNQDYDYHRRLELVNTTPQRKEAWGLLPLDKPFGHTEGKKLVNHVLKADAYNTWLKALVRNGLLLPWDGKYQKAPEADPEERVIQASI